MDPEHRLWEAGPPGLPLTQLRLCGRRHSGQLISTEAFSTGHHTNHIYYTRRSFEEHLK